MKIMRWTISVILAVFITSLTMVEAEENIAPRAPSETKGTGSNDNDEAKPVAERPRPPGLIDEKHRELNSPLPDRFLSYQQVSRATVMDRKGGPLGRIEDFVVDTRNGSIRYAAISIGNEKLFAIPLGSMELNRDEDEFQWRVDIEREKLAKAVGFSRETWPNIANRRWAEEIDIYYGVVIREGDLETNFGADKKPLSEVVSLERASRLIGLPVLDASGKSLGHVRQLVFDRDRREMRYIAVENDRPKFSDEDSAEPLVVPMAVAGIAPDESGNTFSLSMTAEQLKAAPRLKMKDMLVPDRVNWASEVDDFFGLR